MSDIITIAAFFIYAYAGDSANYYLKYHLLNQRAEIYSNTGDYILTRFMKGILVGWITIPIALLHYMFFNKDKG